MVLPARVTCSARQLLLLQRPRFNYWSHPPDRAAPYALIFTTLRLRASPPSCCIPSAASTPNAATLPAIH